MPAITGWGEQMTYTETDSTFSIQKIWGESDCSNGSKGSYHFEIKEGVMYVKAIADDCDRRAMYLGGEWKRM